MIVEIKREAVPTLPSVSRGTITMPADWTFRPSDLSNSQIFAALARGRILYVPELKSWIKYDGTRWVKDSQRVAVENICIEAIQAVYALSAAAENEQARKTYAAWALRSEDESRRRAMVAGAERVQALIKPLSHFDRDIYLYNCENGTLNLKTGDLQPHREDDYLMHIGGTYYDPNAECPLWMDTIQKAFRGDAETIEFYQRFSGYTLTGHVMEKVIAFLYGARGDNGKSTITNAEGEILGDYHMKMSASTLLAGSRRDPGGPSEDLARIAGKRRITASELPEGARWNDSLLKDLSGGDSINARHLHAESFDFIPQAKLVIFGNHKPAVRGGDNAVRNRIRMIPFNHVFKPKDRDMPEKLRAEYPGILRWMVEGCMKWQAADSLGEPGTVTRETDAYFLENNPLKQFMDDRFELSENEKVSFKQVYEDFREFTGSTKLSKVKFSMIMQDQYPVHVAAGHGNERFIYGLRPKDDAWRDLL